MGIGKRIPASPAHVRPVVSLMAYFVSQSESGGGGTDGRDSPSTGTRPRPGLALDRTLVDRSHATIRGRTRTARTTEEMNRRKQTSRTTKQHRTVNPTDDGHLEDREPGNDAERHRLEERNMRLFIHLVPPPRVSEQQQRPLPQLAAGKRLKRHERKVAPQQAGGNPPYGRGQP